MGTRSPRGAGRPLGAGTLEERSGTWWLRRPEQVLDESTGELRRRARRIALGAHRSRAGAERAAARFLAGEGAALLAPGARVSLGAYAARYDLEHIALLRPSSARAYRSVLRTHLLPALGARPIHEIGIEQIQGLVARMHAAGCARSTIRTAAVRLLQLLHSARKDGHQGQPLGLRAITFPRQARARLERRHFSAEEIELLLGVAHPRCRMVIALGAFGGLRCGEILGLAWSDIDFPERWLTVRQNAVEGRLGAPKTAGSARQVPLLPALQEHLLAYRATLGTLEGLLFRTRTGRALDGNYVRRAWWAPLLGRVGLPRAGLHALRHSTPRLLDSMGFTPEAIRMILGHTNLTQTASYLHLRARDLRDQMDRILEGQARAR